MVRFKSRYLLFEIVYPPSVNSVIEIERQAGYDGVLSSSEIGGTNSSGGSNRNEQLMRVHKRLTMHIHGPSKSNLDGKTLTHLLRKSVQENFGDYGAGQTGGNMNVIYFSPATSTGIVRVGREQARIAWCGLNWLNLDAQYLEGNNSTASIRVVKVSGTIKKCQSEAVARSKRLIGNIK